MTPSGLRVNNAMFSAEITKSAVIVAPNAQPTTLRLYTSVTTAKYKKPVQVGTKVMSATQSWLMSVATNWRLTRSGAARTCLLRTVVTT